jgi:hypothetical protein
VTPFISASFWDGDHGYFSSVRSSERWVSGLAFGGSERGSAAPSRVSCGESSARFLHRWQCGFGLAERSRAKVDTRGLGGDRDLLARSRVSALAFLLRRLDPDGQLHKTADTDLLRVAELLEHDLLKRAEESLGLGPGDLGTVSDGGRELCLG